MKKICVYGIGAVGGSVALGLSRTGLKLNAVARGKTLEALNSRGLCDARTGESFPINAAANPGELGEQDIVIISVKTTGMEDVTRKISPLLGEKTIIISMMNGIPWWFFENFGGKYSGTRLKSIDPDGTASKVISAERVVGSVVHFNASMPQPGTPSLNSGNKIILGEPSGSPQERTAVIADLLSKAGFEIEISDCIQKDIWYKLWGNMTMNPISALTGTTMDKILDDPLVKTFAVNIMNEAKLIGEKIGCPIEQTAEERNIVTRKLGAVRTSMLQDVSSGKLIELDSIVGAVREIGEITGTPTPFTDVIFGLMRIFSQEKGLYRG